MNEITFPRDYAALVMRGLLGALPQLDPYVACRPSDGDFETELRLEVPSQNDAVCDPFLLWTRHNAEGSHPPMTETKWFQGWGVDFLLTDAEPEQHLKQLAWFVSDLMNEKLVAYVASHDGTIVSGGTDQAAAEPFPPSRADFTRIRSWRGTYDEDLSGEWPGWPDDPGDPFYKQLHNS